VICVETIGKIRRWHRVDKLSVSKIAKRLSASRNTIAKYLDGEVTKPKYKTRAKRAPVMGAWVAKLEAMLAADAQRPRKEQRTAQRLLDGLVQDGFTGSYPTVQRFVKAWHEERRHSPGIVFIPQTFAPGEAYQFDWSYETVDLGGRPTPVKVAHLRLCHSRVFLAVAYLREAQEMVFDAHWRAFSLWGGSCRRGIYDNLKTGVELIFTGKARQYNRKFLQMASHYLIEPVACTPAAGWEKGQVENQVSHVRENIFTPRLRCADLAELNALLTRRCVELARAIPHPERRERTRWDVFEASERALLVPLATQFEGCADREVRVSFDRPGAR
jgi:transposase